MAEKESMLLVKGLAGAGGTGGRLTPLLCSCSLPSSSQPLHSASSPRQPPPAPMVVGKRIPLPRLRTEGQNSGLTIQPWLPMRTITPSNFSAESRSRANLENRTQCIRGKRNESPFIHREQHVPKIQISCKSRLIKSLAF